jgi:DNA-binding LytR/AlgR family response regulator
MSSQKITAVIADDESLLRDELRDMLAELWPECEIVAEAADGFQALEFIELHKPDIAFLDIKMPRMTGLETAENVTTDTLIVFVTAFDDHAIEAFDKGAVDYLMKPIRLARVRKSLDRLKLSLSKRAAGEAVVDHSAKEVASSLNKAQSSHLKFIQASVGKQVRFIMAEEILYLQSDNKYTRLVTANSEAFIRTSISELEAELDPDQFWRIHRSTIVNIRAIDNVVREEGEKMTVRLRGKVEKLEVSRAHQTQFKGM